MAVTYAPCANAATRHRARAGNLVPGGKRVPLAEATVRGRDAAGRTLTAEDRGRTLTAKGQRTLDDV